MWQGSFLRPSPQSNFYQGTFWCAVGLLSSPRLFFFADFLMPYFVTFKGRFHQKRPGLNDVLGLWSSNITAHLMCAGLQGEKPRFDQVIWGQERSNVAFFYDWHCFFLSFLLKQCPVKNNQTWPGELIRKSLSFQLNLKSFWIVGWDPGLMSLWNYC